MINIVIKGEKNFYLKCKNIQNIQRLVMLIISKLINLLC